MRTYRYLHLDVFTDVPFGGNQLAVFPEPAGLDSELMQSITREMAYSESTFVFPAEDPRTAVRVRIFTPGKELPMAGHPTVGTAFALAHEGAIPAGQQEVVFGLGVGPTRVRLRWDGASLAFAEMEQLRPTFGEPVADRAAVAAALNLRTDDLLDIGTPVQPVSCGVPFLFVPLVTREAVDRAAVDVAALGRLCGPLGLAEEVFLFSPERSGDGATVYSRMFAPGLGVTEDPATGAASGPLGCYLVRHGLVPKEDAGRIVSLQGVKMHHPSRVHIAIGVDGDEIVSVRVGGHAVVVGEGTLRW
ncbi:MAG: PhzF family phenazine biosynthesis protein [Bacteroidales bacterium]